MSTSYAKPARRAAQPAATAAVRSTVASWHSRTLRVQGDGELLKSYEVLKRHETDLATHSPHAVRLLHNLTTELTKRGLLPC